LQAERQTNAGQKTLPPHQRVAEVIKFLAQIKADVGFNWPIENDVGTMKCQKYYYSIEMNFLPAGLNGLQESEQN